MPSQIKVSTRRFWHHGKDCVIIWIIRYLQLFSVMQMIHTLIRWVIFKPWERYGMVTSKQFLTNNYGCFERFIICLAKNWLWNSSKDFSLDPARFLVADEVGLGKTVVAQHLSFT